MVSTEKPYATAVVSSNGSSACVSCVSPNANTIAVSGAPSTLPSTPAMHTSAHSSGEPPGSHGASTVPSPAPSISSGASTPPDVPEPSAAIQITALTASSPSAMPMAMRWLSRSPITS
ncbi:hypothetical protein D3C80_1651200 [compost metagenome]